jgi:hypothetical protein
MVLRAGYEAQVTTLEVKEEVAATGAPLRSSVGVLLIYAQSIWIASRLIWLTLIEPLYTLIDERKSTLLSLVIKNESEGVAEVWLK